MSRSRSLSAERRSSSPVRREVRKRTPRPVRTTRNLMPENELSNADALSLTEWLDDVESKIRKDFEGRWNFSLEGEQPISGTWNWQPL
mmetsp:Transcript_5540/g.16530  ORF Transcript_5540/g.16530 Transcript_5540/m.16530 type:complete len:88 (+) Transcript_5540:63-326(+)